MSSTSIHPTHVSPQAATEPPLSEGSRAFSRQVCDDKCGTPQAWGKAVSSSPGGNRGHLVPLTQVSLSSAPQAHVRLVPSPGKTPLVSGTLRHHVGLCLVGTGQPPCSALPPAQGPLTPPPCGQGHSGCRTGPLNVWAAQGGVLPWGVELHQNDVCPVHHFIEVLFGQHQCDFRRRRPVGLGDLFDLGNNF